MEHQEAYSLTQSPSASQRFDYLTVNGKKRPKHILPVGWYQILRLHLEGLPQIKISEKTGYSQCAVSRILNHPLIQLARQQSMAETEKEFEALFEKVVDNIREQLGSQDPMVQLAAQNQWFKANGKFQPKQINNEEKLTAEDIVSKLLNVNIQVNVDNVK